MAEDESEKELVPSDPQPLGPLPSAIGPPPPPNQGLLILFALLSSNMFALVVALVSEFLSLRGVVDVTASRIALIGAWIAGMVIVCCFVWGKGIRAKKRTTASGAILLAALLWGLDIWAPKPKPLPQERAPYPWVSARGSFIGKSMGVQLEMIVREYPPSPEFTERSVLPTSTIYSVRLDLEVPSRIVEPGGGEDECSYTFRHPEFRNGLMAEGLIGSVALDRDVTAIRLRESARNGIWDGYLLLYRRNNYVDYEQVLHGSLTGSDGSKRNMTVKEARREGRVANDSSLPDQLTAAMLKKFGVPVVVINRPHLSCPPVLSAFPTPPPVPPPSPPPSKADVVLLFEGHDGLSFYCNNISATETARDPKYAFGIWDLDSTTVKDPLPIPIKTATGDFILPKGRMGPFGIMTESESINRRGHRLFGFAVSLCSNCVDQHDYWVYFKIGVGGYFAPKIRTPNMNLPDFAVHLSQNSDALDILVPMKTRMSIH
jgi:hypothetical protein